MLSFNAVDFEKYRTKYLLLDLAFTPSMLCYVAVATYIMNNPMNAMNTLIRMRAASER